MRMRVLISAVALLAMASVVSAAPPPPTPHVLSMAMQNPPVATALDSLRWDQPTADVASLVRFEVCFDASPCQSVTPTAAAFTPTSDQGGPPASGQSAFKLLLPALTVGSHSAKVRACNADVCGDYSTPFAFRFTVVPGTPGNQQLIRGGGV